MTPRPERYTNCEHCQERVYSPSFAYHLYARHGITLPGYTPKKWGRPAAPQTQRCQKQPAQQQPDRHQPAVAATPATAERDALAERIRAMPEGAAKQRARRQFIAVSYRAWRERQKL